MHSSIKTLKINQKKSALELRELKSNIKSIQKERGSGAACDEQSNLAMRKNDYRHRHIAYCLLRGRSYKDVENHCREDNKPNWRLIQEIQDAYASEDVCISEA